jgi:hypothetical protein
MAAAQQPVDGAGPEAKQTAKGLYVPTKNAQKKRSHQVVENKGPQTEPGPKRSHQIVDK